jgi:hypothetical protein
MFCDKLGWQCPFIQLGCRWLPFSQSEQCVVPVSDKVKQILTAKFGLQVQEGVKASRKRLMGGFSEFCFKVANEDSQPEVV